MNLEDKGKEQLYKKDVDKSKNFLYSYETDKERKKKNKKYKDNILIEQINHGGKDES